MGDVIQGTPSAANQYVSGTASQPSQIAQGIGALGQYATIGKQFGWWS